MTPSKASVFHCNLMKMLTLQRLMIYLYRCVVTWKNFTFEVFYPHTKTRCESDAIHLAALEKSKLVCSWDLLRSCPSSVKFILMATLHLRSKVNWVDYRTQTLNHFIWLKFHLSVCWRSLFGLLLFIIIISYVHILASFCPPCCLYTSAL